MAFVLPPRALGVLASDSDVENRMKWLNPAAYSVGETVIVRRSTDEWRYGEVISVAQDGVQLRVGPGLTKDVATRLLGTHLGKVPNNVPPSNPAAYGREAGDVQLPREQTARAIPISGRTSGTASELRRAGASVGTNLEREGVLHDFGRLAVDSGSPASQGVIAESVAIGVSGGTAPRTVFTQGGLETGDNKQRHSENRCEEPEQPACPICLEPTVRGRALFAPECGHFCHFDCIKANVRHGNLSCPICRHRLQDQPTSLASHAQASIPPLVTLGESGPYLNEPRMNERRDLRHARTRITEQRAVALELIAAAEERIVMVRAAHADVDSHVRLAQQLVQRVSSRRQQAFGERRQWRGSGDRAFDDHVGSDPAGLTSAQEETLFYEFVNFPMPDGSQYSHSFGNSVPLEDFMGYISAQESGQISRDRHVEMPAFGRGPGGLGSPPIPNGPGVVFDASDSAIQTPPAMSSRLVIGSSGSDMSPALRSEPFMRGQMRAGADSPMFDYRHRYLKGTGGTGFVRDQSAPRTKVAVAPSARFNTGSRVLPVSTPLEEQVEIGGGGQCSSGSSGDSSFSRAASCIPSTVRSTVQSGASCASCPQGSHSTEGLSLKDRPASMAADYEPGVGNSRKERSALRTRCVGSSGLWDQGSGGIMERHHLLAHKANCSNVRVQELRLCGRDAEGAGTPWGSLLTQQMGGEPRVLTNEGKVEHSSKLSSGRALHNGSRDISVSSHSTVGSMTMEGQLYEVHGQGALQGV